MQIGKNLNLNDFLFNFNEINTNSLFLQLEKLKGCFVTIYGAGGYGTYIYKILQQYCITVSAFFDITAKEDEKLFNIPVYKADDVFTDSWKKNVIVIVALVKDYSIRKQVFDFLNNCGFNNLIDAQSIRCHLVDFDVNYCLCKDDILKAKDLYEDCSKDLYENIVVSHLSRNYDSCIENKDLMQYNPKDIVFYKNHKNFIDCGGYTGDTILQNISIIENAIVFEPNIEVFKILNENIKNLKVNAFLYPCAVSDNVKMININYEGGSSSLTNKKTENNTTCVTIDSVLHGFIPTFIKMDIEGEELNALIGAIETIKKYKPDLAISVYHNINHIWDVPILLKQYVPSYKFYLRTHNSFTMETILYATTEEI